MPTIQFQLKDLSELVGKKISVAELTPFVEKMKGEVDSYDTASDLATISLDDTNVPYLWSTEGIARFMRNELGLLSRKICFAKSDNSIIVDNTVKTVRPFIGAFTAKGNKINDPLIKQLIQLQEKLCEGYGRKRKKLAIGIYKYDNIKFPIYYKATNPESIKFVPLDYKVKMTQQEILESHPKGKEYASILEGHDKYPILIDSNEEVLSFPPIINSNSTGKIIEGDSNLFIEATGTDHDAVTLALNILANVFFERGFSLENVIIQYPDNSEISPIQKNQTVKINPLHVENILGIVLDKKEIIKLLERAGYECSSELIVRIPEYRHDILHEVDVIEDICILYGYENIPSLDIKENTNGSALDIVSFNDKIREVLIGIEYQEVYSPILSNKEIMYEKMNTPDSGTVEIKEYMSLQYSVVRTWLTPILLDVFSTNKHVEYPQNIFEQGLVSVRNNDTVQDIEKIAVVSTSKSASFTEIMQVMQYIFKMLNIEPTIVPTTHNSFITGRVGKILVEGAEIGIIGEIHPQVLENFNLNLPVCGFELNLSKLFEIVEKK